MKIISYFRKNIGYFTPHETKGVIEITFYNYSDLTNPYEPKGEFEKGYYDIELTKDDLYLIESLMDKIKPMKKYNDKVFLLSICIFLISGIIKKPIFKILKFLEDINL